MFKCHEIEWFDGDVCSVCEAEAAMAPVAGGADIERKFQYWIDLGARRKQEQVIKLLEASDSVCNEWAIALIKGENK